MSDTGDRTYEAGDQRYIPHPPASSTFWQDGQTLDAGTAIMITNNLNHLIAENCRQLVCTISANIDAPQDDRRGFGDVTDVAEPADFSAVPDEQQISWSSRTAYRYGPLLIVADKDISIDRKSLRKVRVFINGYSAAGDCYGYVYLTSTPNRPTTGWLAKTTFTESTTGEWVQDLSLDCQVPVLQNTVMPGQNSSIAVFQVYLWIGLRWTDSGGDCMAISAFEER